MTLEVWGATLARGDVGMLCYGPVFLSCELPFCGELGRLFSNGFCIVCSAAHCGVHRGRRLLGRVPRILNEGTLPFRGRGLFGACRVSFGECGNRGKGQVPVAGKLCQDVGGVGPSILVARKFFR